MCAKDRNSDKVRRISECNRELSVGRRYIGYIISSMSRVQTMSEELPILKGILKGNVSYHNARRCLSPFSVSVLPSFLLSRHSTVQRKSCQHLWPHSNSIDPKILLLWLGVRLSLSLSLSPPPFQIVKEVGLLSPSLGGRTADVPPLGRVVSRLISLCCAVCVS